jgi:hypothetical protein
MLGDFAFTECPSCLCVPFYLSTPSAPCSPSFQLFSFFPIGNAGNSDKEGKLLKKHFSDLHFLMQKTEIQGGPPRTLEVRFVLVFINGCFDLLVCFVLCVFCV